MDDSSVYSGGSLPAFSYGIEPAAPRILGVASPAHYSPFTAAETVYGGFRNVSAQAYSVDRIAAVAAGEKRVFLRGFRPRFAQVVANRGTEFKIKGLLSA
ncbi:hypothetical protein [Azospirillum baldaniorum]|uniref:hypothetical protein n=1 Tax=Azospirillum baldaniorum TaxID=1064539 RepID=UPI001013D483|nr:hypothetical protein [Azospirillum baldaniorum]